MKHVVFILSGYYPYFSAVGTCIRRIASCLKTRYQITILAVNNRYGQKNLDCYDSCRIVRVSTKQINHRLYVENRIQVVQNVFFHTAYSLMLLLIRTVKYLRALLKPYNVDDRLCRAYEDALHQIQAETPIDVIVPVCIPFESMVATCQYCTQTQSPPTVISYFLDPFSDNDALHRTKMNRKVKYARHLELERKILKLSQHVIIMRHLQQHFEQEFPDYANKICVTEHPLLTVPSTSLAVKSPVNTLVYAGSFNHGVREPDFMLQVIAALEIPIEFNIYAAGNCSETILAYARKYPSVIRYHGSVSKDKADEAIAKANYIISVGNRNANQSPSKIFECLATGKPIIHFYYYEQDFVIVLLNRYPNSICIKIADELSDQTIEDLRQFLMKDYHQLNFDDVKHLYPDALPETTANIMMKFFEEL